MRKFKKIAAMPLVGKFFAQPPSRKQFPQFWHDMFRVLIG